MSRKANSSAETSMRTAKTKNGSRRRLRRIRRRRKCCRSKSRAVFKESHIKPEKFPDKCLNRWGLWVRHHKSVV